VSEFDPDKFLDDLITAYKLENWTAPPLWGGVPPPPSGAAEDMTVDQAKRLHVLASELRVKAVLARAKTATDADLGKAVAHGVAAIVVGWPCEDLGQIAAELAGQPPFALKLTEDMRRVFAATAKANGRGPCAHGSLLVLLVLLGGDGRRLFIAATDGADAFPCRCWDQPAQGSLPN
jgi:hypothetical protein